MNRGMNPNTEPLKRDRRPLAFGSQSGYGIYPALAYTEGLSAPDVEASLRRF